MNESSKLRDVLSRVAPGAPLRSAMERIVQQGQGALIVLGWDEQMEKISSGGFRLADVNFTPAKLAELAKMDGAIILDDACDYILRANAHLLPDPSLETDETGARFRTAQRLARQTGRPVLAVSEERGSITVFCGDDKRELPIAAELLALVNQHLHTQERCRNALEKARAHLDRLEISDNVTLYEVVTVLHRAEMVRRVGEQIDFLKVGLGRESYLVELPHANLAEGAGELLELVARDYVKGGKAGAARALRDLRVMSADDLHYPERVCSQLGLDHPATEVRPLGHRMLSDVPRLPAGVREALVKHFRDARKMLVASIEDLSAVSGVGETRARELRKHLDRMKRIALAPD